MNSCVRLILLFALLVLALPYSARAQGSSRSNLPEAFYQPNVNNKVFEFNYLQTMNSDQFRSTGASSSDVKLTDTIYGVTIGYGLTDSIGVKIGAGMGTTSIERTYLGGSTVTERASGMTDFTGGLNTVVPFSGWSFHFGIEAFTSPASHKIGTTTADGNEMSGGTTITPYIGLSFVLAGGGFWGLRASYVSRAERTENANTPGAADYRINGGSGSDYQGFYQLTWDAFDLDFAGGYAQQGQVNYAYADGTTATKDPIGTPYLLIGTQYQVFAAMNIRAQYEMTMIPSYVDRSYTISAYNHGVASLRLRFEF